MIYLSQPERVLQSFSDVELVSVSAEKIIYKVRSNQGFGLMNEKAEFIIPPIFNVIEALDEKDHFIWYAERSLSAIDYHVIAYFSKNGKLLLREGIDSRELAYMDCEAN